jgi:hypothetical protein
MQQVHQQLLSSINSFALSKSISNGFSPFGKTQKQLHDECKDHNAITDLNFFLFIFPKSFEAK